MGAGEARKGCWQSHFNRRVVTTLLEVPARHTNSQHGEIEDIPMVIVAREDAGRMSRLLASGQALYADLAIPNHIGGPVSSANVIAELKGSEKPAPSACSARTWIVGSGGRSA